MPNQVSPGIRITEIDNTNYVSGISTSIGAFVGSFNWGPVDQIITVNNEKTLVDTFRRPDNQTAKYFLTATSFLAYGNALNVVRCASGHDNATADGSGLLIKNAEHYESNYANGEASVGIWAAKYPGSLGNSLKVSLVTAGSAPFSTWDYASSFDSAPGTSPYAVDIGKTTANDEMHIVVVDEDGLITGKANTVLETFPYVSQGSDAKNINGSTNYYVDVVNSSSRYIWFTDHSTSLTNAGDTIAATTAFATHASAITNSLSGGTDDNIPTAAEITAGYDLFKDSETVDVNLIFAYPDANGVNTIANHIIALATARQDCVAFVSPPIDDTVNTTTAVTNVTTWVGSLTASSYGVADSSAVYVYDKYNDVNRWIGASGHIAGICAYTDHQADPWFSPAQTEFSQLRNVIRLSHNPTKSDRDTLYKAKVNPITANSGFGISLFGDKTLSSRPTQFDRINVRRLFIVLAKAIKNASRPILFKQNDDITRSTFKSLVDPFLRGVQGRRGISNFSVTCDGSNNVTGGAELVADVYIQPIGSINFIQLNFIATRDAINITEITEV